MFFIVFTCIMGPILIIVILLSLFSGSDKKIASNIASKEVIKIIQRYETDRDKNNASLSEMIEYHKTRPTIRYKI